MRDALKHVAQIATALASLAALGAAGFRIDVSCNPENRVYPDAIHETFPRSYGPEDPYPPPLTDGAPWGDDFEEWEE